MVAMILSIGLLFGAGFGSGYVVRSAMSWVRRTRVRKQRIAKNSPGPAGVMSQAAGHDAGTNTAPIHARTANA